jgi:2-octaprenyl-6-methoxyphenol hydroxylase
MLYDLIIIGSGMVGASLAAALRESALKIALIDSTPPHPAEDHRLIALNYSSYCFFKNIGVWDKLAPYAESIQQVHISNRGHLGAVRLCANELNLATLGYVVPAKYINAALQNLLETQKNITLFRPATLKNFTQHATHVSAQLQTAENEILLDGKFLIGADGTQSTVRTQLGIPIETIDYAQNALVTVTELQRPHLNMAYERFHATGAIAMLPLKENRCATIWTDSTKTIQELLELDEAAFLAILQKQFGYRLGRFQAISKRYTYPLKMLTSTQIHNARVLLIGNAAHTLHPIAAQGLNLALAEIAMLTQIILLDADNPNWEKYLAWQQQQQTASTQLSHKLPWLFANDFSLIHFGRQLAMIGLNNCPTLKKEFARRAMGRTTALPRLLLE